MKEEEKRGREWSRISNIKASNKQSSLNNKNG